MGSSWWNSQHICRQLRLKAVREKHLQNVRSKLGHADFVQELQSNLEKASQHETLEEALLCVEGWLEEQYPSRFGFGFQQCWQALLPLLQASQQPARPTGRNIPRVRKKHTHHRSSHRFAHLREQKKEPHTPVERVSSEHLTQVVHEVRSPVSYASLDSFQGLEVPDAEVCLDDLGHASFQSWWEPRGVLDSLRLRLERSDEHEVLQPLMERGDFQVELFAMLHDHGTTHNVWDAQKQVMEKLYRYQCEREQDSWLEALWGELQPLLSLRRRQSGSFLEFSQPSLDDLEHVKNPTDGAESEVEHLWDWEPENKAFQNFANDALGKLIKS